MTLIMQLIFNLNDAISQYTVRSAPRCGIKYRRKNAEKRGGVRRFSSNNYGHRGGISGSKYSQVSLVKVYSQKFPSHSLGLDHRFTLMPRTKIAIKESSMKSIRFDFVLPCASLHCSIFEFHRTYAYFHVLFSLVVALAHVCTYISVRCRSENQT